MKMKSICTGKEAMQKEKVLKTLVVNEKAVNLMNLHGLLEQVKVKETSVALRNHMGILNCRVAPIKRSKTGRIFICRRKGAACLVKKPERKGTN
mmetsp:Transcript_11878/g.27437  ORF Transcript_11878/g.27437 Transcript_11878/m.27437 type:complete len:94 (+) Transcript_11878:1894-2175(+)